MAASSEAWRREVSTVLQDQKVTAQDGLSDDEVRQRQKLYGKNEMPTPPGTPFLKLVLKQFEDLLVLILLASACVSFVLGFFEDSDSLVEKFIEPAVILLILIANAIVGVWQESSAESAIEKLKEYEARLATVLRSGRVVTIEAAELVPGDIVRIGVGDKVPADCRLISKATATINIDQSVLTGESHAVQKTVEAIDADPKRVVDQDKLNMLFSGTLCTRGRGEAVVCLTGSSTSFGRIQASLSEEDESRTPLQAKLDEFGEQLSKVIAVICILVWVVNIGHFTDPEFGSTFKGAIYYFKIAVALAVAAIPEGLPAVVTTCLALGTMKMAKKNAIVRTLPSVETLGCTTVICSDKTGTLTTNKMSVRQVCVAGPPQRGSRSQAAGVVRLEVEGSSFDPFGAVRLHGEVLSAPSADLPVLGVLAKVATLCNDAHLSYNADKDLFNKSGDATEAALKVLAEKLGTPNASHGSRQTTRNAQTAHTVHDYFNQASGERQYTLEFSRERKSMSVVQGGDLLVKGAPESILSRCTRVLCSDGQTVVAMDQETAAHIEEVMAQYAAQGLRTMALAQTKDILERKDVTQQALIDIDQYAQVEKDLIFVGLVGMQDPPRKEVPAAIEECFQAGIRVVVITGDHIRTAESICRQIGIFQQDEDLTGKSFTGSDFVSLSDRAQAEAVRTASLFSRVEPAHKQKIVDLLMSQGEVVAMTGDGVNDAPALKKADIGIAMGTGTAVAKEASDMVLQDDNFATIVMAVEEGRAIYQNTKQFIRYLVSSNIGEVLCIFFTAMFGLPEALIPVQLLWVNLVTDGLPATALGFNKADSDIMVRKPRGRKDPIIDKWMFFRYASIGLYIGVGTVYGFVWWFMHYSEGPQLNWAQLTNFHKCSADRTLFAGVDCDVFHSARASTVSLSVLVLIEMFNTFNALSENQSLLVVKPWSNPFVGVAVALSVALHCVILYIPWLTEIFHTAPLNYDEWMAVFLISAPVIFFDEILKFFSRRIDAHSAAVRKSE